MQRLALFPSNREDRMIRERRPQSPRAMGEQLIDRDLKDFPGPVRHCAISPLVS
jgi:hypothetical protein